MTEPALTAAAVVWWFSITIIVTIVPCAREEEIKSIAFLSKRATSHPRARVRDNGDSGSVSSPQGRAA
jgi:hypothetical protein